MERQAQIDKAASALDTLSSIIPEAELLLDAITVKHPGQTGLPAHIKFLTLQQSQLEACIAMHVPAVEELIRNTVTNVHLADQQMAVLKRCSHLTFISKIGRVSVVDGGHEWIVIRPKTWTLAKVARDMAEDGWEWGEYDTVHDVPRDVWADAGPYTLARAIMRLVEDAKAHRVDYRIPRIRVVMPSLRRSENDDVGLYLDVLEKMDPSVKITISCADSDFLLSPVPDMATALQSLVVHPLTNLTSTLNLDQTILMDLVSDITHLRLKPENWLPRNTQGHIQEENAGEGGIMTKALYPVLQGRTLVCTSEVVGEFMDLVTKIGTETERERARLLLGLEGSQCETRAGYNKLTIHPLPDDLQVPITVIPTSWASATTLQEVIASKGLPSIALPVSKAARSKLSPARIGVFLQGWLMDCHTLTGQKEMLSKFRVWVDQCRLSDEDTGPRVWRIDVTRNLLATRPPHRTKGFKEQATEVRAGQD
ncbi:uncharacterized protein F5Z01DRAFT_655125 [Emericellopsis atlantica]|uniref:DUF1308 domain-containing protein n=1 Tax=Emericellopsis atlantica TaxID=2614577 RepID=A0A9P7ZM94_9HYPO|nr:uncharacterized protein F5Z01DRAFT_655125 [Emericellopsis atlantica]KAG9254312.1 hypothetical protein F5Z01DRAFT_655125 [Emericellopsis atlantica]